MAKGKTEWETVREQNFGDRDLEVLAGSMNVEDGKPPMVQEHFPAQDQL